MILQNLITGLLMGSIYGMVSVGLSLLFGVMKIVNFAHGAVMMVGMYLTYIFSKTINIDPYLTVILVIPFLFGLGYLLGRIVEPILIREKTTASHTALLLTMGISLIIVNGMQIIFGPEYYQVESALRGDTVKMGNMIFNSAKFIAGIASLAVYAVVVLILFKTDLGKALRAVSQDMDAAKLMGIDERQICRIGFGLSSSISGIAGVLLSAFYYISPTVGDVFQLKAFIIVILGGLGSIPGSLIGGIIVGVVESVGASVFNTSYAQMIIFLVFLIVLILKPHGILGKEK